LEVKFEWDCSAKKEGREGGREGEREMFLILWGVVVLMDGARDFSVGFFKGALKPVFSRSN
jgi:hypothetical protein